MPSYLSVHVTIRIAAALVGIIAIAWIRYNDSKRERRRLTRQGDCFGDE